VRFTDFLRSTVLISAAAATALAAVTLAGVNGTGDVLVLPLAAGWWVAAGLIGVWLGRRGEASPPIASLLASARMQPTLPELQPGRTLVNRLWPLMLSPLGADALRATRSSAPVAAPDSALSAAPGPSAAILDLTAEPEPIVDVATEAGPEPR